MLIGDSLIHQYRFEKNYYFVSGDNLANSQDSRYWGMLSEEYIVGKATWVWLELKRKIYRSDTLGTDFNEDQIKMGDDRRCYYRINISFIY